MLLNEEFDLANDDVEEDLDELVGEAAASLSSCEGSNSTHTLTPSIKALLSKQAVLAAESVSNLTTASLVHWSSLVFSVAL